MVSTMPTKGMSAYRTCSLTLYATDSLIPHATLLIKIVLTAICTWDLGHIVPIGVAWVTCYQWVWPGSHNNNAHSSTNLFDYITDLFVDQVQRTLYDQLAFGVVANFALFINCYQSFISRWPILVLLPWKPQHLEQAH